MKIHGMCLVKNEDDIVAQTLIAAIEWCDFIYIFDNGSTDKTWEIVLSLSKQYEQIIPYKQEDCVYSDFLRSQIFNHYKDKYAENDWLCLLDADEFYIDNPRHFLSDIQKKYQVVWNSSFQYYFTDKALELYKKNPCLYDDEIPVERKCRYYLNNWSEPRFFRYRKNLKWYRGKIPNNLGYVYPLRIRLKHYQYRSPQQIQKRLNTRFDAISKGCPEFIHEVQNNWKNAVIDSEKLAPCNNLDESGLERSWEERIISASLLNYDNHDGIYVERKDLMRNLPVYQNSNKFFKKLINAVRKVQLF